MRRHNNHVERLHCNEQVKRLEKREAALKKVANVTIYEDDLAGKVSLSAYMAQFEGALADDLEMAVENVMLAYERRYDLPKASKELVAVLEATRGHSVIRTEAQVEGAAKAINRVFNRRWVAEPGVER